MDNETSTVYDSQCRIGQRQLTLVMQMTFEHVFYKLEDSLETEVGAFCHDSSPSVACGHNQLNKYVNFLTSTKDSKKLQIKNLSSRPCTTPILSLSPVWLSAMRSKPFHHSA
jgi:hypothetical protein